MLQISYNSTTFILLFPMTEHIMDLGPTIPGSTFDSFTNWQLGSINKTAVQWITMFVNYMHGCSNEGRCSGLHLSIMEESLGKEDLIDQE